MLVVTAACAVTSGSSVEAGWFHNPWGGSVATFGGGYGSGWYAYGPYSGPYGYSVGYVPYVTGYGAYGASTVAMSAGSSACCPSDCCATAGCTGGNCGTPGSPCQVNSAPPGDPKPQPDTQVPRSNPARDYDQPSRPAAPSRDLPRDDFGPSRSNPSPAAPTFEDPAPARPRTPDDFRSSPNDFGNPPAGGSGTRDDGFMEPVPGSVNPGRTIDPMNNALPFGGDSVPMPTPVPRPAGTGTGTRTAPPATPGPTNPASPAPFDPADPFDAADPNKAFGPSPGSTPERVNRPDLGESNKSKSSDGAEVTVPQKSSSESVDKVPTEATGAPLEVDPAVPAEAAPAADPPAEERPPLEEPAKVVPQPPGADEPLNKDGQATAAPVVHVARRTIQGRFGNPAIVKTMVPVRTKSFSAPAELATIVSRDK